MATCDQLATWVSEAEAAQHALALGRNVEMQQNGEKRLQWTPADAGKLSAYIARLKAQQAAQHCPGCRGKGSRVIGITPIDHNSGRGFGWP